ncbi:MAG: hypothetical protein WD382_03940 [Halofilum sp. (in: g-proteobacteria)]
MASVELCGDLPPAALERLLERYGLAVSWCAPGGAIPGTYWGEPEAGLIGATLYLRPDTPVHSALHEAGHFICMDAARRARLHTDAGGTLLEECGVCYLQMLLADGLPGVGRRRIQADMDAWGYTFRLGSAQAWFESDADDALAFLRARGLIGASGEPMPASAPAR